MDTFSKKARALILDSEGMDQPSRWPGEDSGITLGHGYDLRFATPEKLQADWARFLTADQLTSLCTACGKGGPDAKAMAHLFADIRITLEAADWVFDNVTLPEEVSKTRNAFQAFDRLPADAQGALVSLVYNRGLSFGVEGRPSWESRREMRAIRDALARYATDAAAALSDVLTTIADQIESMKRLWEGGAAPGLVTRRIAEAKLVRSCIGGDQ